MRATPPLRTREGDFIETVEGLIFDVKGLIHPPDRIISFLRYAPSPSGVRERGDVRYKKIYALQERWRFLRKHFPKYVYFDKYFGRELQAVTIENVRTHYDPRNKITELLNKNVCDEVERSTIELAQTLEKKSTISITNTGISGSVLVGLQEPDSDIDLIIYGSNPARRVYQTLQSLLSNGKTLRRYRLDDLKRLYKLRSMRSAMRFNDFCTHENRKVLQGRFLARDFFVRCIRDWDEVRETYGSFMCRRVGRAKISAIVSDDSDAIFTPCLYEVECARILGGVDLRPKRLLSYRGRFCEQAKVGEKVMAFGDLEEVMTESDKYSQLVVGESPRDFILKV